jgi:hypothetical protein
MANANASRPGVNSPKPRPRKTAGKELTYEEAIEAADATPGEWFDCIKDGEILKIKRQLVSKTVLAHGQVLESGGHLLTRKIKMR